MRTAAQRLAGRSSSVLVALTLATFAAVAASRTYALDRELWLIRALGWAAFSALFLALAMTPGERMGRRFAAGRVRFATWLAFRRSLGISAASLALAHAALSLTTYLRGSWTTTLDTPYLRAGLVALAILTALLVTSFPELVALLRVRLWRELHRLAYVAAIFVFLHLLASPFAPRRLTLLMLGGLLAVEALRFVPRPGK